MYLQINELVKPRKAHIKQKCSVLPAVLVAFIRHQTPGSGKRILRST